MPWRAPNPGQVRDTHHLLMWAWEHGVPVEGELLTEPPRRAAPADGVYVPASWSTRFERDDGTGVRIVFEVREGEPVAVEVTVTAPPRGRVDRDRLRAVPVASLARLAVELGAVDFDGGTPRPEDTRHRDTAGRTRRAVTREHLRRVAEVYESHDGRTPTAAVAAAFTTSHSTAARWVMKARAAGLLPETERGQATNRPKDEQ